MLDVSIRTVQRMLKAGRFPNAYKTQGRYCIPLADITPHNDSHATTERQNDTTERQEERQNDRTTTTERQNDNDNDTRDVPVDVPQVQALVPCRYRLQIFWPRLGINFEYQKPIDEHMIKDTLTWLGKKWSAWRSKKNERRI